MAKSHANAHTHSTKVLWASIPMVEEAGSKPVKSRFDPEGAYELFGSVWALTNGHMAP